MALEVEDHALALYTFGGVLVFGGFLSSWLFREKRNQLPFGLGLACCAFGSVAASEFVAFAPLVAVLIWIAWFLAEIHPKQAELQLPRLSLMLPAFSVTALVAVLVFVELVLEAPH